MKTMKYFAGLALTLPLLASCADTDYNEITPTGEPVVTFVGMPTEAFMGEDITVTVNCRDNSGKALSNVKVELSFGGETVDQQTLRTSSEGDYSVTLHVPYLQYVPNGDVNVVATLQNVTTKKTEAATPVAVSRPHFTNLQFVSDGVAYDMVETDDYTYTATYPATKNGFKGHFATADGSYTFGADGTAANVGSTADISFQTATTGDISVTFNTRDYTFSPLEKLEVIPIELTPASNIYTGTLTKGAKYSFTGNDDINCSDWFYDTDWFTKNSDGSFTFNAISGNYSITADFSNRYFRIWPVNGNEPASLNADGTGAIWIIGNEGVNKPTWNTINHGWWTGTENDVCLTPIADKVYQVTLTIGKQLRSSDINFKFFGQANWGIEFNGLGGDYHLSSDNPWFYVNAADSDNGNIFPKADATFNDGDTFVFTIDLTGGIGNGVLTVTKK